MTIASCYLSPEGVVLGADSTATYVFDNGNHYFNHAQKLFEIGEHGTLGIVSWGLGGLVEQSHRTLVAQLGDDLAINPPVDVSEVATRWIALFWAAYQSGIIGQSVANCVTLHAKPPHDANNPQPGMRTGDEERLYQNLKSVLVAGFCIGGHVGADRTPRAYQMLFDPIAPMPAASAIPMNGQQFWGAPNIIQRLLFGADDGLKQEILSSPLWTGTETDLNSIVSKHSISHPILPIRDAIDFTHACIMATIKAIKFSS